MMRHNKSALLTIVRDAVDSGEISIDDLAAIVKAKQKNTISTSPINKFLYYLGGIIILLGLIILIGNYWTTFNSPTRLLIAAGSPIAAYLAAIILAEDEQYTSVATPFFLIFSFLIPAAISISFYEVGALSQSVNTSLLAGFSCLACLWTFRCYRRTDLLVFVIFYATVFYFSLLKYWHSLELSSWNQEYHLLASLFMGLIYLLALRPRWTDRPGLAKALLRFGMIFILFSALQLRQPQMHWHILWEVITLIAIVFNFMLAFHLREKFLTLLGWLVFIIYVFAFTHDYFAHSLGWVLSLILAGLIIISATFLLRNLKEKL